MANILDEDGQSLLDELGLVIADELGVVLGARRSKNLRMGLSLAL